MAKSDLYVPLNWILDRAGAFPVRRGMGDEEAMQRAVELAKAGGVVAIFPEGTRRNKGRKKGSQGRDPDRVRPGGAHRRRPTRPGRDRRHREPHEARPASGRLRPPIELDDLKEMELRSASKIATQRLMQAIHALEQTL